MKKENIILFAIFLLVVALRLFLVLQTNNFSSDDSYYNVRIAENLIDKKLIMHDVLSYGGRDVITLLVFHFILAIFKLIFSSNLVYKILPLFLITFLKNLLATFIVLSVELSSTIITSKSLKL